MRNTNSTIEPWPTRAGQRERYTPTGWEPLVTLVVDYGKIGGPRPIVARRTEMFGPGGHYEAAVLAQRFGKAEVIITFTHEILNGSRSASTGQDRWRRTVKPPGGDEWTGLLKLARPIVVPVRQNLSAQATFFTVGQGDILHG